MGTKHNSRVLKVIEEYNIEVPFGASTLFNNAVEASEILTDEELVQFFIDAGCVVFGRGK